MSLPFPSWNTKIGMRLNSSFSRSNVNVAVASQNMGSPVYFDARAQGTASELNLDQQPKIQRLTSRTSRRGNTKLPPNASGDSFYTAGARSTASQRSHIEDSTSAIPEREDTAKTFADRAWKEDPDFVEREKLVEWLGSPPEIRHQALGYYMAYFSFSELPIDDAVRILCNKLWIKGKPQEVDRVLEAFSEHYISENPASLWQIADIVHVVSFAIILLNTDLQAAELNTHITSSRFIENTVEAIRTHLQQEPTSSWVSNNLSTPKPLVVQPSSTGESRFGEVWYNEVSRELLVIYNHIRAKPILQTRHGKANASLQSKPNTGLLTRGSPKLYHSLRGESPYGQPSPSTSGASFVSVLGHRVSSSISSLRQFLGIIPNQSLLSPASNGPIKLADSRWAKTGPLLWKSMKPTMGRIAKPKRWLSVTATVRSSVFDMAAPSKPGNNTAAGHRLGTLPLLHALAIEVPAPKGTKVRSFGLTLASGETHVFEFQTPGGMFNKTKKTGQDADTEVSAWVRACNYHAARFSRAPLPDAVTNVEYGWNGVAELEDDQSSTNGRNRNALIDDWTAPNLPTVEAQTDAESQLEVWDKQVEMCNAEFAEHSELRGRMMSLYRPGSAQAQKALANWEKKAQYLLTEIVKYETYAEVLRNTELSLDQPPRAQHESDLSKSASALPMGQEHETGVSQTHKEIIPVVEALDKTFDWSHSSSIPTESSTGSIGKEGSSRVSTELTSYISSTNHHPSDLADATEVHSPQHMASLMYERLIRHGCPDPTPAIDPDGFSPIAVAKGGFGDVWTGRLNNDGTKIAIKVLRFTLSTGEVAKKELKRITREIYHWSKLDHENVNKLMGVIIFQKRLGMVSEWMEHGHLREYLDKHSNANRHELCTQVAKGVSYLHSVNMVHGDLKACNILVSSTGTLKITDFDYSITQECSFMFSTTTRMAIGTLRWTAPELLLEENPPQRNTKTDIYALGMTFLETITNDHPYSECPHDNQIFGKVERKEHPKRPEEYFPDTEWGTQMWTILLQCWDFDPVARPTANAILKSLFTVGNAYTDVA